MRGFVVVASLTALSLIPACGRAQTRQSSEAPIARKAGALDCTADSPHCPQIAIRGVEAARLPGGAASPFRGFADPTIREDPLTGRLWMAYSWPTIHVEGQRRVPGVKIHLAHSDDGGDSWSFDGVLWDSRKDVNQGRPQGARAGGADRSGGRLRDLIRRRRGAARRGSDSGARDAGGEPGYSSPEVANLLPRRIGDQVIWYGARLDYFVPTDGGYKGRPASSFRLQIMQADTPMGLSSAPVATLGGMITDPGWGVDVNLSTLAPELRKYMFWNEPALYFQDDTLYLVLRGLAFDLQSNRVNIKESNLEVFSTKPVGDVTDWEWRWVGTLAGHEAGKDLGGMSLTQVDLAEGVDGQLLAIVTPDDWDPGANDFVHYGCRAVEVASIDPPRLARDADGKLKVRARTISSDLPVIGPAACAYDPASSTGILMGRRVKQRGSMVATLHRTGLKP